MRSLLLALLLVPAAALAAAPGDAAKPDPTLRLNLRTRVETFKGSGTFDEATVRKEFAAASCALILCDVWDKHWCNNATERCDAIARKLAAVVEAARARGVVIVHAPSDCMDFYKDHAARKRAREVTRVETPKGKTLDAPPLPIDDSDNGCDDDKPVKPFKAWKSQHPAITVADGDYVSDNGAEVYSILQANKVKTLLIAGVHTNMCILNRGFAIKQMTRWGVPCVLVRDLTDTMYNPKMKPFVTHEEGTALVVGHIEKYWCPSVLSEDVLGKKR